MAHRGARAGTGSGRRCVRGAQAVLLLVASLAVLTAPAAAGPGEKITGTAKSEKLSGTDGNDRIAAKAGRDKVFGRGGNDRVSAGAGNDKVKAGAGKDRVAGGGGKDRVSGSAGADKLKGGGGNDKLDGGSGRDALSGGGGKDKLLAVDGGADKRIAGGPGTDTCVVDRADLPKATGCENLKVDGGPVDPPGPPGPPDPALEISESEFSCPLPVVLGLPTPCTYSLAGTGADTPAGSVSSAGGVEASGEAAADEDGAWTASGNAACTGSGTLEVSFGDETASAAAACPSGNGVPLEVTSETVQCLPPIGPLPSACVYSLAGVGADTVSGTVAGAADVSVDVPVPALAVAGGEWTATGAATCTGDGELVVTFGEESVEVPVDCPAGADNGPLTVTSSSFTCLPPVGPLPSACTYLLTGGGADGATGTVEGDGAGVQVGVPVPAIAAGGSWTATGAATCTADGSLTVTFGTESIGIPVECAATGGGDNGPLTVTTDEVTCLPGTPLTPAVCNFLLAGGGADAEAGTVTGAGGVSVDAPIPALGAGGSWTATGVATCTGDGELVVSFAGDEVSVPVGCPEPIGGGEEDPPLEVVSGSPVNCIPATLVPGACVVALVGTGADETTGEITASGGVTLSPLFVPPTSPAGGGWTAAGAATCTGDGSLEIGFGDETVEVPVTC